MSYSNRNTSGNTANNNADWQYSGAQVDPRTNEQASDYNDSLNNPTAQSGHNASSYGQKQNPSSGYNTRSSGRNDTSAYSGNQTSGNYGSNPTQTSATGYGSNQHGSQQQAAGQHGFGSQQRSYGQDTSSGFDSSTQGNPTMGDKVKGNFEKFAGKMKGDSRQVAEGEARAKGFNTNTNLQ